MKYVFQCKIDGKKIVPYPPWNRFKRGQFIKEAKRSANLMGTFDGVATNFI